VLTLNRRAMELLQRMKRDSRSLKQMSSGLASSSPQQVAFQARDWLQPASFRDVLQGADDEFSPRSSVWSFFRVMIV
jgi:hypothetical protein